jgi:hypothetical protein
MAATMALQRTLLHIISSPTFSSQNRRKASILENKFERRLIYIKGNAFRKHTRDRPHGTTQCAC